MVTGDLCRALLLLLVTRLCRAVLLLMVTGDCAEHSYYYWLLDVQSSTIINGHSSMCRVLLLLLLVTGDCTSRLCRSLLL